jgi:hypothetical protein
VTGPGATFPPRAKTRKSQRPSSVVHAPNTAGNLDIGILGGPALAQFALGDEIEARPLQVGRASKQHSAAGLSLARKAQTDCNSENAPGKTRAAPAKRAIQPPLQQ